MSSTSSSSSSSSLTSSDGELEESALGSKEYWDLSYQNDLKNFNAHGDVGEVWFGKDLSNRVTSWIAKSVPDKSCQILDLGCGNGMLCVDLFRLNYSNIIGVDYSEDAISLATEVAKKEQCSVTFKVMDILEPVGDMAKKFDLILDKGTYDAVSLMPNAQIHRKVYVKNVCELMKDQNSLLIVTSCNWAERELQEHFRSHFVVEDVIPMPQFTFGGKVGNMVTSLVFKCKN